MKAGRVLVLQMKRIGDLLLTAPALAALRQVLPQAEVLLVADATGAELAPCLPGVTEVLPYRRGFPNAATWAAVTCGEWDLCLDFTGTDRSALMTRLSCAPERVGYEKFSTGLRRRAYTQLCSASVRDRHTVDFHLDLLEGLPGLREPFSRDLDGSLNLPAAAVAKVTALLQQAGVVAPLALIHPGTARREKFWPAARWVEVVDTLGQLGFHPVMTGTGTGLEAEDVALIRKQARAPLLDLTGQLSLVETAAVIARAAIALGVDSMAMHLAALQRLPQVVLFGPTNPFHWRPRHARALVLAPDHEGPLTLFEPRARGGEMDRIATSAVIDAIERLLPETPLASRH